jgi:molybdate transport system substrate-binding protein
MATRHLMADLAQAYGRERGCTVTIEFVGGVDAARRVRTDEAFDLVFLARDAIEGLESTGHVRAGSLVDIARASVAVAVAKGAPHPSVESPDELRDAVRQARSVGYSTGPSGAHLARIFDAWGVTNAIKPRLVQAPAGVPVAELLVRGDVELGFQQLSELIHAPGIDVLGLLPREIECITVFSGAVCTASSQPDAARDFLVFSASERAEPLAGRHGLERAATWPS